MRTQAAGDAFDRLHADVLLPYVSALRQAGSEAMRLAELARRVESLLVG